MSDDSHIQPRPVSSFLVVLLGLFLPGVGHVYLGQKAKGALIFAGALLTGCLLGLFCLYAALDGLYLARKLNRGEAIGKWEDWGLLNRLANFF